jgi:hypothetical protein
MEAATGYFHYISEKINGLQIKPFVLGEITSSNIGDKVFQGTSQIPAELRDSGMMRLYMPSSMVVEYHKYNELHYGTNQDYTANNMFVKEYPDVKIVELKNCGTHRRLVWTLEGNIKTFEHVAGEMLDFRLSIKEWSVTVTKPVERRIGSRIGWKEMGSCPGYGLQSPVHFCQRQRPCIDRLPANGTGRRNSFGIAA